MLMQNLDGHLTELHAGRNVKWKPVSFSIVMTLGLHENETVGWERLSLYIKQQQPNPKPNNSNNKTNKTKGLQDPAPITGHLYWRAQLVLS